MSTQGMRFYQCSAKHSRFQGTGLRPHQGKRTIRGQERKKRWMRKDSDSCCWPEAAKLQPSSQVQRTMGLRMQDKRRGTQSWKGSGQGRLYFWTSKKAADCHRNFIRTYKLGPMNWCNRDSDRSLLLRHTRKGWKWTQNCDRREYSVERTRAGHSILGFQRRVPAVSWVQDLGGSATASTERSGICSCVAVCAVTAAKRNCPWLRGLCE